MVDTVLFETGIYRLLFGLYKPQTSAFSISPDTLTDAAEPVPLMALETIVNNLLEVINYSAPSPGKKATMLLFLLFSISSLLNLSLLHFRYGKCLESPMDEFGDQHRH